MCDQTTSVMSQVQAGGVTALAVLAEQRSPALPNAPYDFGSGLSGAEMVLWNALFRPRVRLRKSSIRSTRRSPKASTPRQPASDSAIFVRAGSQSAVPEALRNCLTQRREVGQGDPRRQHQSDQIASAGSSGKALLRFDLRSDVAEKIEHGGVECGALLEKCAE